MIIVAVLFALICIFRIKFSKHHCDYMSFGQTEAVKGIFAVFILLSHLRQYIAGVFAADYYVVVFLTHLGQLMVAMFFFYSGFGIMQSHAKKPNYAKGFFKNRIVKTLLHFDLAVLLYLVLSLVLGEKYAPGDYLFSWIGWTSLGNSNWFVFVMLCLYCAAWLSLEIYEKWKPKNNFPTVPVLCTGVSILLWILLRISGKDSFWYNTLLCFPAGMWFSVYKNALDRIVQKNIFLRLSCIAGVFALFAIFYFMGNQVAYSLCACLFCLLIVLVTMNVKVDNPILRWLGKHSFEIYIIQRFPMILFTRLGLSRMPFLFLLLSVVAAGVLAIGLKQAYTLLDKRLIKYNTSAN